MGNASSPLRRAMRHRDVEEVRRIVTEAGEGAPDLINEDYTADCLLDSCNRNLQSPVHTALSTHSHAILEILFQYGGDPNSRGQHDETPLHRSAYQNNVTGARLTVKCSADIHAQDVDGEYAVHYAARSLASHSSGNVDVLRFLLEEAGRVDDARLTDRHGETPLHKAARKGNAAAVTYLLSVQGVDPQAVNAKGQTARDLARGVAMDAF